MDHYQTLGLAKNASPDEIKKAYRKLASQNHPDKGGDTAKFQNIQTAYDILSDPNKRQQYDNPMPQGMHGFPPGFQFHTGGMNINDIFGQMFGQGNPFTQNQPQMLRTQINVELMDAYKGGSHVLKVQTPNGVKVIDIDIPKGVNDGTQLRYDNILEGASLIVEFRLLNDLKFERRGKDLLCNHSISVLDLIVGTAFEFVTISGKVLEVTIPPKTQPFMQLKLSGQGMPIQGSPLFGDQIILLKPFMPDTIPTEITESILRSKTQ
jgi:DnaJ-class molecular chaperone